MNGLQDERKDRPTPQPQAGADTTRNGTGGWLRRLLGAAIAWTTLGATVGATAQDPVPQHWLAYAQQAGTELQRRLGEDSVPANQLHDWMERSASLPQRQDPVVVKLWIAANGRIIRSEFTSLGDAEADAALESLLQPPLAQPPADMRQPLVLGLSLRESAEPMEPAGPGAHAGTSGTSL
ncbi:hypothetical protein ACTJI2_07465 [Pseudoxanthomonas sp. 22568]|uniref:hypothetical protein n=1 Tax=unclassified Pseudoxanthomonas TaxID=2645906 RepID=UPI00178658C5|nr:hypothetical protein [Pseudoxanthomonas sp. PXM04]MBD9376882.1 hypothetical protein [Pseudoxanthomonas sp. PXM04]